MLNREQIQEKLELKIRKHVANNNNGGNGYIINSIYTDSFGTKHCILESESGEVEHLSFNEGEHYELENELKRIGVL